MAAPAFALLWADHSEVAAFTAGHSPGPTTFGSCCSSPALFVTGPPNPEKHLWANAVPYWTLLVVGNWEKPTRPGMTPSGLVANSRKPFSNALHADRVAD